MKIMRKLYDQCMEELDGVIEYSNCATSCRDNQDLVKMYTSMAKQELEHAQLYQDGVAIPGAFATATPAEAGDPVTLPIVALVRNCGYNCSSVLTVRINAGCTINNLATTVEKL